MRVAAITLAAGLVSLALFGAELEEVYGVRALFQLRGPLPAPPGIAIVSIDRASAGALGLPLPLPRRYHARLVSTLREFGAKAIIFDLIFREEEGAEDEQFAEAIRAAGQSPVVLLQDLGREIAPGGPTDQLLDRAVNPVLRDAAAAVAPFPVPTDSRLLARFWTFRDGVPTLPAVAFQLSASDIANDWGKVLAEADIGWDIAQTSDPPLIKRMSDLHRELQSRPGLASRIKQAIEKFEPEEAKRLSALLALYAGEDTRLLNFVGPAHTITTIPYASIIQGIAPDVKGKVVVVGTDAFQAVTSNDTFPTPFSRSNGIDLSGVEILATGVSNLMEEATLKSSAAVNVIIVIVVALILGFAAASASDLVLGAASVGLLLAIPTFAYYLFVTANLVTPIVTPLALQLPIGVLAVGLSLRTAERRLRRAVESAAHQFLPHEIADRLASGPVAKSAVPAGKLRSAIFLATDIEGFTTIAERLSPEALSGLVKDYFEPLFDATLRHGGEVLNVTGDSMMCAWYTDRDPLLARRNAIAATLDMQGAINAFSARHRSAPLPTRFALRAGTAAFGIVGGSGRYVATLVGDVANTVSRIDSLNKLLRTRVLASKEVFENIKGLIVRPLGTFAPVGKSEGVDLIEILTASGEDARVASLVESFREALVCFDAENWSEAAERFGTLLKDHPNDGPTSYFLRLSDDNRANPPPAGTARPIRVSIK